MNKNAAVSRIRKNASQILGVACIAVALGASQVGAQSSPGDDAILVSQSPSLVTFVGGTEKSIGTLKVRIDGPDGHTVFESASDAGIIDWIPRADLPDGNYRWDAWFLPQTGFEVRQEARRTKQAGESDAAYESGIFRLRGGALITAEKTVSEVDQIDPSLPERIVGQILGAIVPTAAAADQTVSDSTPELFFEDTSTSDGNDWIIQGQGEPTSLFGIGETLFPQFQIEGGAPVGSLVVDSSGNIGLGTDAPQVELEIADTVPRLRFNDTDGGTAGTAWTVSASADEFRLQDNAGGSRPFIVDAGTESDGAPINSLYIESPTGDIGLGTSTPQNPLHIVDIGGFQIRLDNGTTSTILDSFGGEFRIGSDSAGSQLQISEDAPDGSVVVSNEGFIGAGTFLPAKQLNVEGADTDQLGQNDVMFRIENTTTDQKPRRMIELINHGSPLLVYKDTARGTIWNMSPVGNSFAISLSGSGAQEFLMDGNGNAEFQGDVTANGVVLDSSRSLKTDFSPVDGKTVLAKLRQLDVSQWRYKDEPGSERHVGPMAEDFRRIFGLGDGRHIELVDTTGITMAAIKALESENQRKSERIAELEGRIQRLERLVQQ